MADPPPIPEPPTAAPDSKAALRARARHVRRAFVGTLGPGRRDQEDQACRLLLSLLHDARCVGFYSAHGSELDPGETLQAAAADLTTALPRVGQSGEPLAFHVWKPGDPLHAGPHRVKEPAADAPGVTPDVIVVPLLAFDRSGGRLGQGGGHYDRTLAAYPDAFRIGLAWSVQEVDKVPVEWWDMRLDAVVTEREWLDCR